MFLKNAWYVAALDHEVGRTLTPVTILGEEIVLFRREDGRPAALENACPHRKLPLAMGRLKGDTVECGYHGLTFDCTGVCVNAPGAERIPKAARVRSYPVEQRYGLVWIWMGDAALADSRTIMRMEKWDDPTWGKTKASAMVVACDYLTITDNLLDPCHVTWVHPTSFAGAACDTTPLETTLDDTGATVSRWIFNEAPAPFYQPFLKFAGNCDRKQQYEVHYPSLGLTKAIFVPAGAGGDDRPLHADAFLMHSYGLLTPLDAHRTRYFYFQLRNFAPGDETVSSQFAKAVHDAFQEDKVVLEAVHRGITREDSHLSLQSDRGPLSFRREIARRIAAESTTRAAAE